MCDNVWQREGAKIGPKYRDVLYGRPSVNRSMFKSQYERMMITSY